MMMNPMQVMTFGLAVGCVSLATTAGAATTAFPNPLPAEAIPKVETLPAHYPSTWSFLNYAGDRIELRNVGSDTREVKGQLQAHDSATLLVSDKRPELCDRYPQSLYQLELTEIVDKCSYKFQEASNAN